MDVRAPVWVARSGSICHAMLDALPLQQGSARLEIAMAGSPGHVDVWQVKR